MSNDTVRIELDLPPINPKKRKRNPDADDYADRYTIKFTRSDGEGVTEDEARAIMAQWLIHTPRRKRK